MSEAEPLPPVATADTAPVAPPRQIMVVVDAATGEEIQKVIEADTATGQLRRFDVDAAGNLIREGDAFKVITEIRAIRIEMRDAPGEQASTIDPATVSADEAA